MRRRRTNERSPESGGGQFVCQVDPEDGVTQQNADLKGDSRPAVQRQAEAHHVHQHEEDAGNEEADHVQQGAPADQQLHRMSSAQGYGAGQDK